jgi:hypothetical protein
MIFEKCDTVLSTIFMVTVDGTLQLQWWRRHCPVDGALQQQWQKRHRAVNGHMLRWQRQWRFGRRAVNGRALQRRRPCRGRCRAVDGMLQWHWQGMRHPVDSVLQRQWQGRRRCQLTHFTMAKAVAVGAHGALQHRMTKHRTIAFLLANNRRTNNNQPAMGVDE